MNPILPIRHVLLAASAGFAALIASCTSTPSAPPATDSGAPSSASNQANGTADVPTVSGATTPLAYRRDAAHHLYGKNAQRIFQGKLPAMLYAIGVLQVDVDGKGHVTRLHWMRAPGHAPEVVAEIERTVRQAAPYPIPARMGRVTYTDTWLWDRSGRFQLDTLTEGQL